MSLAALTVLLADQEAVLERLHYRLAQLSLLAATGRHGFLAAAADEANDLTDALAGLELARALMVADLAATLGAGNDQPTLAELCELAPVEWRPVLDGHRARMRALQTAITATAATGRARVEEALRVVGEFSRRVEARADRDLVASSGYSPEPGRVLGSF